MADVSVRPATVQDAGEIGRIQVETWRTAYTEILPAAVLASLDVDAVAAAWASAVASPPSNRHRVLVALEKQWTVGFVAMGPTDDTDGESADAADTPAGSTAAIAPILVEPRWGRRGHGSRLLAAATDTARADGTTRLIAWVPEDDEASQSFLLSAGWAPEGLARALDTGAGELREIRLHTWLGD